ncbi:MAG: PPC domain-containing protein [Bacteroidales bacterium]|nr:PPC domain-containing protein [Bacteroidales bacterium]
MMTQRVSREWTVLFPVILGLLILLPGTTWGQKKKGSALKAPEPGYAFPAGGNPGSTLEVTLGGYDWTPDVELIPLDPRVRLTFTGELGPVIVPPPPFWFGPKGTIAPIPLPRERTAKLTLPAGLPPGPIYWTTASANGIGTNTGTLWVGDGRPEVLEQAASSMSSSSMSSMSSPSMSSSTISQVLPALPVTVNGRLARIEEVDRYSFSVPRNGPVTLELFARRLGIDCNLTLTVRNPAGNVVADAVDTAGQDLAVTFSATANTRYTVELHDLDFRGDCSCVYRLVLTPGPRVVATIPAVVPRGATQSVVCIGYGVATGAAQLESVTRTVHVPTDAQARTMPYRLETPHGVAPIVSLPIVDTPDHVALVSSDTPLTLPIALTGVLEKQPEGRFRFQGKKGDMIRLEAVARALGSPLDVSLVVLDATGKELARNDDLPNTTDAGLNLTLPADGLFTVIVSDVSGNTGSPTAVYRLLAERVVPDFTLTVAPRGNLELGGTANLLVTAQRQGGFSGPITLQVSGLPAGVTLPAKLEIPAKSPNVSLTLSASPTADVTACPITITGTATVGDQTRTRPALASFAADRTYRNADNQTISQSWICTTLPPRISLICVEADGGRKVHRGSTHPAEVTIERHDGFTGPVSLQMSAKQSYQRQGITGPDLLVPADVSRAFYPCFMPEWLETTRTSRMELIGVIRVPDPKGRERYLATPMAGRITMSIEGEILKITSPIDYLMIDSTSTVTVPLKVLRSAKLPVPVKLELLVPDTLKSVVTAEPIVFPPERVAGDFFLQVAQPLPLGRHEIRIRGTALQDGKYAVVSEVALMIAGTRDTPRAAVPVRK